MVRTQQSSRRAEVFPHSECARCVEWLAWQKSSFSGEAANCVNVAIAPDGAIALRESDSPDAILSTTSARLGVLLTAVKRGGRLRTERAD